MKKYSITLVLSLFVVSMFSFGCSEKIVYKNPQRDYRQCLKDNSNNSAKCDTEKQAYEKDVQELKGTSTEDGGAGSLYEE